jgi:hypothetical protein
MSRVVSAILTLLLLAILPGCATLEVTPPHALKPATARLPVSLGVQAAGERLVSALKDPQDAVLVAASGTLFEKVTLLPPESRFKTPADTLAAYGSDYLLGIGISDISVSGNLNPIWFYALPLIVFKPYTPMVTFAATISLEATLRNARTGAVIMQKEFTEIATDHFSPINPEDKVRRLITRSIKNALVAIMEETRRNIAAQSSSISR